MTERADAIVIGAGHNGLVCASYLARDGMNVLVLEATGSAGGMAAPRPFVEGYQAPGLAHVAYPVATAIRRDLGLDRFGYEPGPPVDTIVLDADGRHVTLGHRSADGAGLPAADREAYPDFRQRYLDFARTLGPLFENRPPRLKGMPFADKATLAKLGWGLRFGLGRESMYEFLRVAAINIFDVLNDTFEDERLKAGIAFDAVIGSAMGPRTPGTVLTWLSRLFGELNGPLALQAGPEQSLVGALTRAAEAAGVTLRVDAPVTRILVDADDRVSGVELADGERLQSRLVVSGVDPRATFGKLVGAPRLDAMFAHRVGQIRGTGVVAKLHLALDGVPAFTGLDARALDNRLLVAPSMRFIERAFNHSKYRECSAEPVMEITLPSRQARSLAPEGHHVMSINVAYAPFDIAGGWQQHEAGFVAAVIRCLERYAPGVESMIVAHEFLSPADIEREYGAVEGHWHHGEMSIHQSFMLRPLYGAAQYDAPLGGLYLCGAGCHPGGGITGLPGRNAARRILERENGA